MDRAFKITAHAYTKFPHEFKESQTFNYKASSSLDVTRKVTRIIKELFDSGEYTVDISVEEIYDDDFINNLQDVEVQYL
jgi:hypothetical protein